MQTLSANLKAALLDIDARVTPRTLVDLFELYDSDAIPGVDGFDPADAVETFSGSEITWNLISYRREVINRSDIVRNMGEKTNSVTITFSNISRYLATLAQSQAIEGMILVIRTVVPSVTDDSLVLFVGRCDKPGDITKQTFELTARQDFGNINQTLPPRKFTADDPEGRLPGDDLYEGIPFIFQPGTYAYPFVQPSTGTIGRLLQRRETVSKSEQFSSVANTPFGSVIPEILGRCQMELIPFIAVDKGIFLTALWAVCNGPISAVENIKTQQAGLSDPINSFETPPDPAIVHLGDLGGTGTNTGNLGQADLGGGSKFSHLAYVEGAIVPTEYFTNPSLSDPNVLNDLPTVTALVLGRRVALPDGSGVYNQEGWTDNLVHLSRFVLTHPNFVNINEAFMEDSVNYRTALHCDEPLIDETESQTIVINTTDITQAGDSFTRYRATGILTPRYFLYNHFGDVTIIPEVDDGPYTPYVPTDPPEDIPCGIGFHRDPDSGLCVADATPPGGTVLVNAAQPLLRKRYTGNVPITGEVRAVDFLYKTLFPAFKGFMRVNKRGKYEIRSEQPSDATRIRSAIAVGATSIPVYDVTPWKSGDLLIGRLLLGLGLTNSEVRNISSADYSTSGNAVTLSTAVSGSITATASGANLSGGSTTVQASGTVTIGGTPSPGNQVTITIDGVAIAYLVGLNDTTGTVAAMLAAYINATKRINYYISAEWDGANVVTIRCLHGALNVDALLKTHTGPIADPTTAPTVAAAGSGTLQAGTYLVAYANQTTIGLTALTLFAAITLTANQKINVSSLPAFPAGVTGRQFFVSDAPNSARMRYLVTRGDAANFSIDSLPLPGAANPPSYNSTSEELIRVAMSFATNSQDVFKPWSASTVLAIQGNATDDTYLPTVPNGHKYQLTTAGTTGASEPSWPTTAGATVTSGTAVFTEIGSTVLQQAGLTRANISKDSYRWPLGGQQSSVNQVKGSYRDAKNDFALTPYRVNDPVHQAQVKKTYPLEFDGSAIDNYNQFFRIANWLLSKNREGDWFNALETGPQGLVLEEGDVICASDDSGGLINVATRIEELRIKPNHDVTIQRARKYSTAMFSDDVGSHSIAIPSTLKFVQTVDSIAEFLDTPPTRESDVGRSGFWVSVSRDLSVEGDWRGYQVYVDYGDGYVVAAQGDVAATLGETTSILNDVADTSVLDTTNDVTFTLKYATPSVAFQSCTEADLVANPYRNLFLLGGEYVQAATIVDNGDRSFTISDIFHARFETECVDHSIGERVVYIDGAEVFVPTDPSRIGIEYNYKFVTTNQDVADAAPVSFTWQGRIFTPDLPTGIEVYRDTKSGALANQIQLMIPTREHAVGETVKYWVDVFSATAGPTFTVDASTNIFTSASHGLVSTDTIALSTTGDLPSPLHSSKHYYLRDITTHTFKLSATNGGDAIDLLDTGSGTHKFTRRVRHMPVVNIGAFNPAVLAVYTPSDTPPDPAEWQYATASGSGGWALTHTSEWDVRNNVDGDGPGSAGGGITAVPFALFSDSGAEMEFTLGTVDYEPGLETDVELIADGFSLDASETIYRRMRFTVKTDGDLPTSKAGSRRWKLTIYERIAGSLALVYTDPNFELPGMKYRMQLSGTELRYYRDYGGPNSALLYRSTLTLPLPVRPRFVVATEHIIENIKIGGSPECITTYPDTDMISDFGTQPSTVRFRVYEERIVSGVSFFGNAADFIS